MYKKFPREGNGPEDKLKCLIYNTVQFYDRYWSISIYFCMINWGARRNRTKSHLILYFDKCLTIYYFRKLNFKKELTQA